MKTRSLLAPLAVALAAAAVASGATASTVTFAEAGGGTGNLPATAQVAAAAGFSKLTITGDLDDGRGGNTPNLVDLFKFTINYASTYFFDTFGSDVADTQLFLFDAAGMGVYWNNDASLTPSNTHSAFATALGVGDYYIAVTFYGLDADDGTGSIFDTLGNGGGPRAGAGAVASWTDFNGGNIFDNTAYGINIRVPEPGALALSLLALGLMAGFGRRRA